MIDFHRDSRQPLGMNLIMNPFQGFKKCGSERLGGSFSLPNYEETWLHELMESETPNPVLHPLCHAHFLPSWILCVCTYFFFWHLFPFYTLTTLYVYFLLDI